jgi:hypothetical protein
MFILRQFRDFWLGSVLDNRGEGAVIECRLKARESRLRQLSVASALSVATARLWLLIGEIAFKERENATKN